MFREIDKRKIMGGHGADFVEHMGGHGADFCGTWEVMACFFLQKCIWRCLETPVWKLIFSSPSLYTLQEKKDLVESFDEAFGKNGNNERE